MTITEEASAVSDIVPLFQMELRYEQDLVVARQRIKQVADKCGVAGRQLTSLVSACSEVLRKIWRDSNCGTVVVFVEKSQEPVRWRCVLANYLSTDDALCATTEAESVQGTTLPAEYQDLAGAKVLVDDFHIDPQPLEKFKVTLGVRLSSNPRFCHSYWVRLAREFQNFKPQSAYDAVRDDQQELIRLTDELQQREDELQRVNDELESTNQGVLALYAELESKAEALQQSMNAAEEARKKAEAAERQQRAQAAELAKANQELEYEIRERERAEKERERLHEQLLESSRLAGMAEVAVGVLHNIGNTLNSINVSTNLLADLIANSCTQSIGKIAQLLVDHQDDLASFVASDPRGKQLPAFLSQLAGRCNSERERMQTELDSLRENIEHINCIVVAQQSYAKIGGTSQAVRAKKLLDEALLIHAEKIRNSAIQVGIELAEDFTFETDRHKILQILINLVGNAIDAIEEANSQQRTLEIIGTCEADTVEFRVVDSGIGIAPESFKKIFQHGFTTKPSGHGFGLHSCALTARELGGGLTIKSDGPGTGATFVLQLPRRISASSDR